MRTRSPLIEDLLDMNRVELCGVLASAIESALPPVGAEGLEAEREPMTRQLFIVTFMLALALPCCSSDDV